ncbi:SpoIIIAH-like family protein [Paenibacillus beijingensis]|uniref:Mutants block sporulation after engulfment (Stage III sporulation) n=1 Tax=Paenibacillus beijingensis TaxID=1126833 RepID=A0A0D5NPS7_9BACL|nr:SpoIIIAH-like family protein [Paenibacillus beijingensis]AJY77261.1 hypothetical protein VN24_25265 [Paenibacillus beijingensis]
MNSKRQTIWLVSMLSLMVILSAYYLFTEDTAGKTDLLTESAAVKDATETAGSTQSGAESDIVVSEVTAGGSGNSASDPAGSGSHRSEGDAKQGEAGKTGDAGKTGTAGDDAGGQKADPQQDNAAKDGSAADGGKSGAVQNEAKTDKEVLEQWESQGQAANYFDEIQQKNEQRYAEQYDKLMSQISDVDQDAEQASKAVEELNQFEGQHTKLTGIQETLTKQYKNVAIDVAGNYYKIVVQSEKMDKSQAADILDLVMKELGIGAEAVSIQYVP